MSMLNVDEKAILQDFKKAIKLSKKNNVINVDESLRKKLDSFLLRIESGLKEIGSSIPPHRHRQTRLVVVYVSQGDGKQIVGRDTFTIKDRTLVIVPPGVTTSYAAYSTLNRGYYLSFNLNFFFQSHYPVHYLSKINLFKKGLAAFCYLEKKWGQSIENIFEIIFEEGNHQRRNKNEMIALKILELIIICDRLLKASKENIGDYHSPLLVQYMDLISEHYKEQHSTSYYAGRLRIHPNSLNATAKRYLNQSAKTVLDTKLVSEAKDLLYNTNLSVKEIAYELGFNSPSHFFRFFKRYSGNSPLHYRQNI